MSYEANVRLLKCSTMGYSLPFGPCSFSNCSFFGKDFFCKNTVSNPSVFWFRSYFDTDVFNQLSMR